MKTMDYRQTEQDFKMGGFQEQNAILRPMLGHPVAMAAYATAYAMGAAFLGHEMHHSRYSVIRKLWRLPQTISIEQNTLWICLHPRALPPLRPEKYKSRP